MTNVPQELSDAVASGTLVLVVGSGVSIQATRNAQCASWRGLMVNGLQFARRYDLLDEDQLYMELATSSKAELLIAFAHILRQALERGNRFGQWLGESVGSLKSTPRHELLGHIAALDATVITTNYDNLLADALGRPAVTWKDRSLLDAARNRGLIHIHGHYSDWESIVLDPASYERLIADERADAVWTAIDALKTIAFVGCGDGLEDPHFQKSFEFAERIFREATARHYVLCVDDEVNRLERRLSPRLKVASYGRDFDDLSGFLARLAPMRPSQPGLHSRRALPAAGHCFGRDAARDDIRQALLENAPARIAVLGRGGSGKTTLALSAVQHEEISSRFGEPHFVLCDGARNRDALVLAVATALGVVHSDNVMDAILEHLIGGPAIPLLDGLETPWDHDRRDVETFLAHLGGLSHLRILVTLRGTETPAHVAWTLCVDTGDLEHTAAVKMFLAIAGPSFANDPHLDGFIDAVERLPLAIHILAHLAQRETSLAEMWRRWEREHGAMLSRPRQQHEASDSLYAAFDLWLRSPRLDDDAQQLLRLLAMLPDGMRPADVAAIMTEGSGAAAALRGLGLLDRSNSNRVRPFALLRDYLSSPPDDDLMRAASDYYLALAKRGDDLGFNVAGSSLAATIAAEASNIEVLLRTALVWSAPAAVVDAAVGFGRFIRFTGIGSMDVIQSVADQVGEPRLRARCLRIIADLKLSRSDVEGARADCDAALELATLAGDERGMAECARQRGTVAAALPGVRTRETERERRRAYKMLGIGGAAFEKTEPHTTESPRDDGALFLDEAERYYRDAMEIFRRIDDVAGIANCIRSLADIALGRRQLEEAERLYKEARSLFQSLQSAAGEATCVKSLGHLAYRLGDLDTAERYYAEALPMYRRVGYALGEGNCLRSFGKIAAQRGDRRKEREWMQQARISYRRSRATRDEAKCVLKIAASYADSGSLSDAAATYREAIPLYYQLGDAASAAELAEILALGMGTRFQSEQAPPTAC